MWCRRRCGGSFGSGSRERLLAWHGIGTRDTRALGRARTWDGTGQDRGTFDVERLSSTNVERLYVLQHCTDVERLLALGHAVMGVVRLGMGWGFSMSRGFLRGVGGVGCWLDWMDVEAVL